MASRRDRHHARLAAVNALGKTLSRRARSKCELCEVAGAPLKVVEVAGSPEEEPDVDWALLVCETCAGLCTGELPRETEGLRFLTTAMWSELQPTQIVAVRTLRKLDDPWASEALDGLWLEPDIEALVGG